ncbi:hypothetical protein Gbfr_091_002 [Gluconobacter frateurii M-2]|nr:hypothetical protein Gbfr_091_002 [Gluconobacter frateurii M-2]
MQHIHAREWLNPSDMVRVDCDHQCNILVMDDYNYSLYQRRQAFRYLGGFFKRLPATLQVPNSGHWNTVIDLAGGQANIRYNIQYLK